MTERFVNWLIFTCLIGLIPLAARLLIWALTNGAIEPFSPGEIVAYGIVLQSANINEVNLLGWNDPRWKTMHNGMSIFMLVAFAVLLAITILDDRRINQFALLNATILLAAISTFLSTAVAFRCYAASRTG